MALIRRRTIEENAQRLPAYLREEYQSAPLDRFYIDGVEYSGFYDFSYIEEKTYLKEPERSNTGVINDLQSYVSFLTPRFTVSYKMMNIEEYRRFINTIKYKNEFSITCYSIDDGKMVTNRMYVAPYSMPKIYHKQLQLLGIMDYAIEFIGTNAGVQTYTLVYNYGSINGIPIGSASTDVTRNVSSQIGYVDGARVQLNGKNLVEETLEYQSTLYQFNGWFDSNEYNYVDGEAYYIMQDKTVTAEWRSGGSTSNEIYTSLTNCSLGVGMYKPGTSGYYIVSVFADEGYTLTGATVTILFNNTNITSTAYILGDDGVGSIKIEGLDSDGSGDIEITVSAVAE